MTTWAEPYRQDRHSVYRIEYHLVWASKRRRRILTGTLRDRLDAIVRDSLREMGCEVLGLEIQPDHLHLYLAATPRWSPAQLVGRVKSRSAPLLREEFVELQHMPAVWTRSFLCSTEESVPPDTIARYVAEQATRD